MHTKVIERPRHVTDGRTDGRTDWRTDGVHSYNPLPTPWWGIENSSVTYQLHYKYMCVYI